MTKTSLEAKGQSNNKVNELLYDHAATRLVKMWPSNVP